MAPHRRSSALAALGALLLLAGLLSCALTGTAGGAGFVAPPLPSSISLQTAPQRQAAPAAEQAGASAAGVAAGLAMAAAACALLRRPRSSLTCMRAGKKLEEFKVGDELDGTVSRVGPIGVYIDIGAEKDALLPRANVPKGKTYNPGDKIEGLKIFELMLGDTPKTRKIRVSTASTLISDIEVGQKVEGTVASVTTFGVFFDIGTTTDVLAPTNLAGDEKLAVGQKVSLTVQKVEGDRITVSVGEVEATEAKTFKVGDVVEGTIKSINPQFGIFTNIGASRDALLRASQLERDLKEYKVGDKISGLKVASVAGDGKIEVSTRRLSSEVKVGEELEGEVSSISDFGIFFDCGLSNDVLAPKNQLSKPMEEYSKGQVADLRVTQAVGDRISVTDQTNALQEGDLVRGSTYSGKVTGKKPGIGLFLDIGAMTQGLLREAALPKPIAEYKAGDVIEDLVLIRAEGGQIELSLPEYLTQAVEEARESGAQDVSQFKVGMVVEGKISRKANFGMFVDVGANRDALWAANQLPKPMSEYSEGEVVSGLRIVEADAARSRLAVSTRPGPADFKVGEAIPEAKVTKIQTFGIFVDIGASAEALVPKSLLEKDTSEYKVGEILKDLTVNSTNPAENKIALQQVGASADAGDEEAKVQLQELEVGSQVKGVVRKVADYGVFMDIGVTRRDALLPRALMGKGKEPGGFTVDDTYLVYIARVDVDEMRITVSETAPPKGGFGAPTDKKGGKSSLDALSHPLNMAPDLDFMRPWFKSFDVELDKEPMPWFEWAEKHPTVIRFAEKEDMSIPYHFMGWNFNGHQEMMQSWHIRATVPQHLRKPDAPDIRPEDVPHDPDEYRLGMQYHGIKPEIHTKYRTPPLNDPNKVEPAYLWRRKWELDRDWEE